MRGTERTLTRGTHHRCGRFGSSSCSSYNRYRRNIATSAASQTYDALLVRHACKSMRTRVRLSTANLATRWLMLTTVLLLLLQRRSSLVMRSALPHTAAGILVDIPRIYPPAFTSLCPSFQSATPYGGSGGTAGLVSESVSSSGAASRAHSNADPLS